MRSFVTLILLICLGWFNPVSAQAELVRQIDQLADMMGKVQVKKDVFDQVLTYQPDAPYRITLNVIERDSRGRETRMRYRVNLGLLSEGQVDINSIRDRIEVAWETRNEPLIEVFEDGEIDGYEDEMAILATDIDNARDIKAKVKSIIPLARASWEQNTAQPETYAGLLNWVSDRVAKVDVDGKRYQQSLTLAGESATRVRMTQEIEDGSKSDRYLYEWNLIDLDPSSIRMNVKGKEAYVEVRTVDRKDYIQVMENGEVDDYTDNLEIQCPDAESAQLLAYGLRKLPALARDQQVELPVPTSISQAHAALEASLQDIKTTTTQVKQRLAGSCQVQYDRDIEKEGSLDEQKKFGLDLSDLNRGSASIEVSGRSVTVAVSTRERNRYIYVSEGGEQQNYVDDLAFYAADIPTARRMLHHLTHYIDLCPTEVKPTDWAAVQRIVQEGNVAGEGLKQSVELLEENPCKWAFNLREDNGRKLTEVRYEFNLSDLDPSRLEIDIKGKSVLMALVTRNKEDIIKTYTDGGAEQGFDDEFEWYLSSVPAAKEMLITLRSLIEGCQK